MSVELGVMVGIALAVATVIAIVLPLRASTPSLPEDTSTRADLMARRESAFQVLRDLDSDFEAGKLSEEDYRPMRVESLAQAAEIMAQLDAAPLPSLKAGETAISSPQVGENGESASRPAPVMNRTEAANKPVSAMMRAEAAAKPATWRLRVRQDVDKFCPHCGASRGQEDVFCRKCGKSLT